MCYPTVTLVASLFWIVTQSHSIKSLFESGLFSHCSESVLLMGVFSLSLRGRLHLGGGRLQQPQLSRQLPRQQRVCVDHQVWPWQPRQSLFQVSIHNLSQSLTVSHSGDHTVSASLLKQAVTVSLSPIEMNTENHWQSLIWVNTCNLWKSLIRVNAYIIWQSLIQPSIYCSYSLIHRNTHSLWQSDWDEHSQSLILYVLTS